MYTYHERVLDGLAGHGLMPGAETSPQQLRDALRELYKYEIRRLRDRLIAGEFPKSEYAGRMQNSDDDSKKECMTRRSLRSDQIGCDNGLAVTRLQRVKSTESDRNECRSE